MRSRVSRGAAIAALAVGISLVAFAGISIAASGGNGSAAQTAQIGEDSAPGTGNNGDVANEVASGNQQPTNPGGSGEAPVTVNNTSSGSNSKSLPFTGLLVIPVLLVGLALLGSGLVLRRRELTARS